MMMQLSTENIDSIHDQLIEGQLPQPFAGCSKEFISVFTRIARVTTASEFNLFVLGQGELPNIRLNTLELHALNEGIPLRSLLFKLSEAA